MPENKVLCGGQDCGVLRKNFPLKVFPSLDYQQRIPNYSRNSPPVVDCLYCTGLGSLHLHIERSQLRMINMPRAERKTLARQVPPQSNSLCTHLTALVFDETEKIDIVRHCDTLTLSCQVT